MKHAGRQESATRLDRPGPYRLSIPRQILEQTAIQSNTDVSLSLEVHDGYPRLAVAPANTDQSVTRRLSERSGENAPGLTLPQRCVEAAGLVGSHALPYASADSEHLYVGLSRESTLTAGSLAATETAYVSAIRQGDLSVSLTDAVAGPLAAAATLYCSVDHYDGALFVVLDGTPETAPDGTIEVTANPNTGRTETSGLSFNLPRVLGRLCGFVGTRVRWGRTDSGNRLVGVSR